MGEGEREKALPTKGKNDFVRSIVNGCRGGGRRRVWHAGNENRTKGSMY